jgi:hypothetical protein
VTGSRALEARVALVVDRLRTRSAATTRRHSPPSRHQARFEVPTAGIGFAGLDAHSSSSMSSSRSSRVDAVVMLSGWCDDVFAPRDGVWLHARRVVRADSPPLLPISARRDATAGARGLDRFGGDVRTQVEFDGLATAHRPRIRPISPVEPRAARRWGERARAGHALSAGSTCSWSRRPALPPTRVDCRFATPSTAVHGSSPVPGCGMNSGKLLLAT